MNSAELQAAAAVRGPSRGRGPGRRAGRRKTAVLEAACRVIAERGADATRFADVAAESGVPVSTLQYYFGSREDLLVAAFRHASSAEIAALEAEVAAISDPWTQLERIITRSLTGYQPDAPEGGRLWIESWHFGIRDAEMRADALRDNTAWRRLVAQVLRRGIELGTFGGKYDPDKIAVLAIAAADGMGIPLSLADPLITPASAARDVMTMLRDLLAPARTDLIWSRHPCIRATASFWSALLDVGDGLDRRRLRQGLGLVVGPDAFDVVAAPVG